MNQEFVAFGSAEYWLLLLLLILARGADFFSTWLATPRLTLEANPLARALGWRGGLLLNAVICAALAAWPLPALMLATTSILVAARNCQSAWLSRTMGEPAYRTWLADRLSDAPRGLYYLCLGAQSLAYAGLGVAVIVFAGGNQVLLGLGFGFVGFAIAVPLFTWLGVRGLLRRGPRRPPFNLNANVRSDAITVPPAGRAGKPDPRLSPAAG
ncbi:MAG: hypothetical protein H7A45_01100 [Verrucomicrobiales bacterium]|nr:hypothetical protein [Verrucomicrobiales bacterium]